LELALKLNYKILSIFSFNTSKTFSLFLGGSDCTLL
jgi:hypothetical protein